MSEYDDGEMPAEAGTFLQAISDLRDNKEYSDLFLECGGKEGKVHKAIVCMQSPYLAVISEDNTRTVRNAVNISLTSSPTITGGQRIRSLSARGDAGIVDALVQFMYTFNYAASAGTPVNSNRGALTFNVAIYTAAEKFGIQPLARLATSRFCSLAKQRWDTADFCCSIRALYSLAPNSARAMNITVVEVAAAHAEDPLESEVITDIFRKLVDKVKSFGTQSQLADVEARELDSIQRRLVCLREDCNADFALYSDDQKAIYCPCCRAVAQEKPRKKPKKAVSVQ